MQWTLVLEPSTRRQSVISDGIGRFGLQYNSSTHIDSDLNESQSLKSNPAETSEVTPLQSVRPTTAGRTSIPVGALRLVHAAISTRHRNPNVLMQTWHKRQKISSKNPDEPLPLTVGNSRSMLLVGDNPMLSTRISIFAYYVSVTMMNWNVYSVSTIVTIPTEIRFELVKDECKIVTWSAAT
jgi:hypothetical protein